ncbi:hypothetical protein ACSMXN_18435 [Jatrophihabitans sp. DSM 45814]
MTDLLDTLRVMNVTANRPGLPSAGLVRPWDELLAGLISTAAEAEGRAATTALAFQSAQPGGAGFRAAMRDDADFASAALDSTGTLPDSTADGPLLNHLKLVIPAAFVEAQRAEVYAAWADGRVRGYPQAHPDLVASVDRGTDQIRDTMRDLYEKARDSKSRRPWRDADDMRPEWAAASSLYEWLVNPRMRYRARNPRSFPKELEWLEYEADIESGGAERSSPPDPPGLDAAVTASYPVTHRARNQRRPA